MDRFLVKAGPGDPREGGEEPAPTGGTSCRLPSPSWQRLRAEGLNCDYTVLFGRAEADEIFRELEQEVEYFTGALAKVQVFGKWHSVPRKQAAYGDAGLSYTFSGLTLTPKPWIPVLERIRDRVCRATGQTFNFVFINRDFRFRHRDSRGKRPRRTLEVVRLQLAHGSLLMMNYPTNTYWYHSLPVRKKVLAPRVNLTFRKILPTKK
ncbi:DNA oxidative demethylase ALKBH2 isoform X2 [Meriones unguiculatus]|uniref:DNA oxidative demethylase ALKBH2 isoform X2 n=1 Tax=Meriones unguiculatus TaxID=10047 RepID=UPI00293EA286|nr:DNA oxidative demethylase ALKBH2 isoform X2 [Meriones unguiculatus]